MSEYKKFCQSINMMMKQYDTDNHHTVVLCNPNKKQVDVLVQNEDKQSYSQIQLRTPTSNNIKQMKLNIVVEEKQCSKNPIAKICRKKSI